MLKSEIDKIASFTNLLHQKYLLTFHCYMLDLKQPNTIEHIAFYRNIVWTT